MFKLTLDDAIYWLRHEGEYSINESMYFQVAAWLEELKARKEKDTKGKDINMKQDKCVDKVQAEPKKFDNELKESFPKPPNSVEDNEYRYRRVFYKNRVSYERVPVEKELVDCDCNTSMLEEFAELNDKIIELRKNLENKAFIKDVGFEKTNLLSVQLKAMQIYAFSLLQQMKLEGFSFDDKMTIFYNGQIVYEENK